MTAMVFSSSAAVYGTPTDEVVTETTRVGPESPYVQSKLVGEIMDAMASVTGTAFEPQVGPRRPGNPARVVADGELAARDLDWTMRHSLEDMVASAWSARCSANTHPTQGET